MRSAKNHARLSLLKEKISNLYREKETDMGGFFGVASKKNCILDLFYGVDYHSHLGTRRGGMAVYGKDGFSRNHLSGAIRPSAPLRP